MHPNPPPQASNFLRWMAACAAAAFIAACGGGQRDPIAAESPVPRAEVLGGPASTSTQSGDQLANSFLPNTDAPPNAKTIAALREGARLNTQELAQIGKTGVIPKSFNGPLLSGEAEPRDLVGPKRAATRIPTYRFYNPRTGAHFYTSSDTERDNVIATLPFMAYEGRAFDAGSNTVPGLSPVHRFYNTQTGVHFYTISEAERAHVAANLPQFHYEGIAYHASTLEGAGYTPLYRFFYTSRGFHFYTNSLSERDRIIATLPQYSYEGVGYYVLGSDWQEPLIPGTRVTFNQCYAANSNALVDCNGTDAKALNSQQDGHRFFVFPGMSFDSAPPGVDSGGTPIDYPLTSCIRDAYTGLLWEGKKASGDRAGSDRYTNQGNQLATDASGYINALNAANHCGHNDWRLPTVEELQGVVDFGVTAGPLVATGVYFPNTPATTYWTGTRYTGASTFPKAWTVSFSTGNIEADNSSSEYAVRAVRGTAWSGPRYIVKSASYSGDTANNVVLDRKTGVLWRRCLVGQLWTGTSCLGSPAMLNHENALRFTQSLSGWRMPSVKELGSLVDFSRTAPALDATAFPGAPTTAGWTATPYVQAPGLAWAVTFFNGTQQGFAGARTSNNGLRLVVDLAGQ